VVGRDSLGSEKEIVSVFGGRKRERERERESFRRETAHLGDRQTPLQGEGGNSALQDGVEVARRIANATNLVITRDVLIDIHRDIHTRTTPRVVRSLQAARSYIDGQGQWPGAGGAPRPTTA